jgi:hypothetical protein
MTLKMHYILYCTKINAVFLKINLGGYTPRAPFKREGKRGREGNGKRREQLGER